MAGVSIVIVTHGQRAVTERCLRSLESAIGARLARDWELVLVDNDSPDDTPQLLRAWSDRARVLLLNENRNFAGGCNAGAAAATGSVLIFLNNDTEVPAGALELLAAQVREPGVGVAGCRLLFPNGTIQHAGVAFIYGRALGGAAMPQHVMHHLDGGLAETQGDHEADCVTAACMAVRAEVFRDVGGFDERYLNGLEDVDLCLRVRSAGHRIVYRGDITLIHHEGTSRGQGAGLWDSPEKLSAMRHNDELFTRTWARHLEQDDELARLQWDAQIRDQPPAHDGETAGVAVLGQPSGIGPAAAEARAWIATLSDLGVAPAAYDVPRLTLTARLSDRADALLSQAQRRIPAAGSPVIHIPGGRHDPLADGRVLEPAIVRLAQPRTALSFEAAQQVWVTAPAVREALARDGLDPDRIAVIPPPVPRLTLAAGGGGVLAILPLEHPGLAASILRATARLPRSIPVRLLPTTVRRGWERNAAEINARAEPLRPCSDEDRFAALAAEADVVVAVGVADPFERRALVSAAVGTPPLVSAGDGPTAAALGADTAVTPDTVATALAHALSGAAHARASVQQAIRETCDPTAIAARLSVLAPL